MRRRSPGRKSQAPAALLGHLRNWADRRASRTDAGDPGLRADRGRGGHSRAPVYARPGSVDPQQHEWRSPHRTEPAGRWRRWV